MTYTKSFEVRWSEIDVNWHMRNTAYSELGTATRIAFLSENGFPPDAFLHQGFGPVILREETKYHREIRLGQIVTYTLQLSGMSPDGSHFEMYHDILVDGGLAGIHRAEGSWLDLAARKLRTPPDPLQAAMLSLDRTEDFRELRNLAKPR